MTTEGTDAKPRRRIRVRAIAGLVVACLAIGSLALVAVTVVRARTTAGAATSSPSAVAPSIAPASASAALATLTIAPATPAPSPSLLPAPTVREFFVASGTEPAVSADPFHPGVVAVVSEYILGTGPQSGCSRPAVRISKDGGETWGSASYPWRGGCQDIHAVLAWGPNSRLWAGDAMGAPGGVAMSVSYSDDFGSHWSQPFLEPFTRGMNGCFPAIGVDNWPGSPNFGTVYVAYNWLPSYLGTGVAVMASRDGATWAFANVTLDTLPGYPFGYRIGYRVQAAPDGTAFVSFYQSDLKLWDQTHLLNEGPQTNIGRMGFEIARVHYKAGSLTADLPAWATDVDHTDAQWQSGLAVDSSGRAWLAVETEGRIGLGGLDGKWREFSIPGRYSFKPSLAISGQTVFLGWHAQAKDGYVWTYYTFSYDGGATFQPPALVTNTSWSPRDADVINGVGLRENASINNGVAYYAYGDARSGLRVYMARITA